MKVRNLTTKPDEEFLAESVTTMLAAIEKGDTPTARFWAEHATSFVTGNPTAQLKIPNEIIEQAKQEVLRATGRLPEVVIVGQNHGASDDGFASLQKLLT